MFDNIWHVSQTRSIFLLLHLTLFSLGAQIQLHFRDFFVSLDFMMLQTIRKKNNPK